DAVASYGTAEETRSTRATDSGGAASPLHRRSGAQGTQAPKTVCEGPDYPSAACRKRSLTLLSGMRSWLIGFLLAAGICCGAAGQDYPTRTVTLIVPYPPGGGVDGMARIVAEKLSTALGQQVIVDNRSGGSGNVGTRAAAKSAPDGYTLFLGHTGSISINPALYANAGYDPRRDFSGIALIASMPVALLAHPTFPARTVSELIALAKRDPGKLNFGTSAVGTGGYLCAELFKSMAGL